MISFGVRLYRTLWSNGPHLRKVLEDACPCQTIHSCSHCSWHSSNLDESAISWDNGCWLTKEMEKYFKKIKASSKSRGIFVHFWHHSGSPKTMLVSNEAPRRRVLWRHCNLQAVMFAVTTLQQLATTLVQYAQKYIRMYALRYACMSVCLYVVCMCVCASVFVCRFACVYVWHGMYGMVCVASHVWDGRCLVCVAWYLVCVCVWHYICSMVCVAKYVSHGMHGMLCLAL